MGEANGTQFRRFVDDLLQLLAWYHSARTRNAVGLGEPLDGTALMYILQVDQVIITLGRLPVSLKDHLERPRLELLDPANASLRTQFERRYDEGLD